MAGEVVTQTLNDAFGYDGWSMEVRDKTREVSAAIWFIFIVGTRERAVTHNCLLYCGWTNCILILEGISKR
jgi:hypothetical protein